MSRSGRTNEVLNEWRDHPKGCTKEHGWVDGYDGVCTDDPWDIATSIDQIDPFFRKDEIERLRAAMRNNMTLERYDELAATPQGRTTLKNLTRAPKES